MNELAELTIRAHGGMKRWGQFETVSAQLVQGGALWALKGQAGTLDDTSVTVGIRSEWASHAPFGASGVAQHDYASHSGHFEGRASGGKCCRGGYPPLG